MSFRASQYHWVYMSALFLGKAQCRDHVLFHYSHPIGHRGQQFPFPLALPMVQQSPIANTCNSVVIIEENKLWIGFFEVGA